MPTPRRPDSAKISVAWSYRGPRPEAWPGCLTLSRVRTARSIFGYGGVSAACWPTSPIPELWLWVDTCLAFQKPPRSNFDRRICAGRKAMMKATMCWFGTRGRTNLVRIENKILSLIKAKTWGEAERTLFAVVGPRIVGRVSNSPLTQCVS